MFTSPIGTMEIRNYKLTEEENDILVTVACLMNKLRNDDFELSKEFNFSIEDMQDAILSIKHSSGLTLKKTDKKFEIELGY